MHGWAANKTVQFKGWSTLGHSDILRNYIKARFASAVLLK